MPITRRSFFKRSGLLAATSVTAPTVLQAAEPGAARPGQKPRHIIHLVSDGMSAGTLTCADHLSHLLRKRGVTWIQLHNHPQARHGLMDMRSLDSLVTDSSAASSSWGSGSRIANGAVNILPDGRELTPLYTLFGQAGWKRALVTTTEITHATPAGFAANDGSRGSAESIAAQYLDRKVEVLLGGGQKYYDPAKRKDKVDLWAKHQGAGYHVMKTREELLAAPLDKRWVGTFDESHLPYTVDQNQSKEFQARVPTLAEMTRAALKRLENEPHFIMQVEGGRVDHGCHQFDAAAAFYDQIAFDEAIEVCLEFQKKVPDTLLVITTDHGNGNPGLSGIGKNYVASPLLFANLKEAKASHTVMLKQLGQAPTVAKVQAVLKELTGYAAPADKVEMFLPYLEKKGKPMFSLHSDPNAQLGLMLANHLGVSFISASHTSDFVPITALGPGAEKFGGFIKNTDVFYDYLGFAGIDFRNPEMPLQTSLPANGEAVAAAEQPHWLETVA
ncbi:MAG: alkaline phosphatase [Verrucomicrobiota bacterium]